MDAALKKHGQLFTLALIAAASVMFGMALAGGLNLTIPGRAANRLPHRAQGMAASSRAGAGLGPLGQLGSTTPLGPKGMV